MMSSDDLDPNQTIDPDILDDTRIHPEDYDVARKLADSQELDEEDLNKQPPSQAISDLLASENGNGASNGKLTAVLNSFTHLRKGLLATKAPPQQIYPIRISPLVGHVLSPLVNNVLSPHVFKSFLVSARSSFSSRI
ncbi:hypothetical protein PCANC_26045 [Puccinia coronata f. sp. avenae]|uniref:HHH domain-containing protein n=1 Tax=Puccinia coronata f. sp. avenae TaxID=200324 RepID=A0A2N5SE37_9BASI|nr:hypothetical protein PCANC_26045 [Puccinia coronata f. sp. avenae]